MVMDAVDAIVPSVDHPPPLHQALRTCLVRSSCEYRHGHQAPVPGRQKFVQAIVDQAWAFNTIWKRPENLPTETEIHAPQRWIDRVLKA